MYLSWNVVIKYKHINCEPADAFSVLHFIIYIGRLDNLVSVEEMW